MPKQRSAQVIELLLASKQVHRSHIQQMLKEAGLLDDAILLYKNEAIALWEEVADDFNKIEKKYCIPFKLHERPHLYAIDSLMFVDQFHLNKTATKTIAKIYIVFFLMVSYFDDHVEHRDKVFSKFNFENTSDRNTQYGAVPFSFIFISLELITNYLQVAKVDPNEQLKILKIINENLLSYTQHFTIERDSYPSISEVFEMKQRQVSGKVVAVLATLISPFVSLDHTDEKAIYKGLFYLGSMMQITDDIRDAETDLVLCNANLLNACINELGQKEGTAKFAQMFENEYTLARGNLEKFFNKKQVPILLSLPFYPFCLESKE